MIVEINRRKNLLLLAMIFTKFQVLMGDIRNHKVAKDNQSFCFAMIFTKVKCVLSASQRRVRTSKKMQWWKFSDNKKD